jgi:hypothetical protein
MKMRMLVVALMGICISWVSHAAEGEKERLAEELLSLTNVSTLMDQYMAMTRRLQRGILEEMGASRLDQKRISELQDALLKVVQEEMSWDKLKGEFIQLYCEIFTEEELQGILEFYRSPAGRKFIEKQPELIRRAGEISRGHILRLIPKLRQVTEEFMEKEGGS